MTSFHGPCSQRVKFVYPRHPEGHTVMVDPKSLDTDETYEVPPDDLIWARMNGGYLLESNPVEAWAFRRHHCSKETP